MITDKQLLETLDKLDYVPSYSELADILGFKSKTSVFHRYKKLERLGLVKDVGKRSMRVTEKGRERI